MKIQKDDPFSKVSYMSENATRAMMDAPDVTAHIGLRDHFLMIFLYDTGARIQELLHIRLCDIKADKSPQVLLYGKGDKVRSVPLMKDTVVHLKHYMDVFHTGNPMNSPDLLFYVKRNGDLQPMSDDTVWLRLQKYVAIAQQHCPDVPMRMHPHLWRHTRAMHLYQHGMPLELVSQWLGHSSPETTLVYAYADTEHKRKAIARALGEHAVHGISDDIACPVTDEELLKQLYGL